MGADNAALVQPRNDHASTCSCHHIKKHTRGRGFLLN
jgi:hypothetical protein